MVLNGPSTVYEREVIHLTISQVPDISLNTEYWWTIPYMDPLLGQSSYNLEVNQSAANFESYPVTIQDGGLFTFKVVSECGLNEVQKFVEVLPLPTPCFDNVLENTMVIKDSATGNESVLNCSVNVFDSDDEIELTFEGPTFTSSLEVRFNEMPGENSTYYLRNIYGNGAESDIQVNDLTQAYVVFVPSNSSYNDYKLIPLTEDIHFKRDGNQVILTMCGVRFKFGNSIRYVTAKIVFEI